jgi:DNA-binding GntR family transcriptional regulator
LEIRLESLAQQAYAVIRQEIAERKMAPGSRILERDLIQRLGISRTPIREALLKLEGEGVVVVNRRRSYNVRLLAPTDIAEIYQTLGILEGAVASSVLHDITPQDLKLLKEYNQEMKQPAKEGNLAAFGRWNQEFHNIFLSRLGNRTLRELCDSVRHLIYIFPVQQTSMAEWLEKSVREHDRIIRLTKAKKDRELATYFRDVHWGYRRNQHYVEDAFDMKSAAADSTARIAPATLVA